MQFLNRNKEILRIKKALSLKKSCLIIVYGRRRLGKTRILQQLQNSRFIYYVADQRETPIQIESLSQTLSNYFPGFNSVHYPDWESLLSMINQRSKKFPVLILDEFPYLVKNSPELPSLLQKLYDKRDDMKYHLILCGSSQQMMHQLVMDYSAPLYGRANEILKISPMNIYWLKEALKCTYVEAVEEYAIWGGVPRYWEIRQHEKSLTGAINKQILDVHGLLYDEPFRLFLDDTRDTIQMSTLISIIAAGANRLSEIASRIGKPATHLNRPLQKLIDLNYIKREVPHGSSMKNAKKTLYKVTDPFINFYYKYVIANKSAIEIGQGNRIFKDIIKNHLPSHTGYYWEELCRQALPLLFKDKLFNTGQRWWGTNKNKEQSEIDIVSLSNDNSELIIGEVKWSSNYNIHSLMNDLENKINNFELPNKVKKVQKVLFLKEKPEYINEDFIVFTPKEVINSYKET